MQINRPKEDLLAAVMLSPKAVAAGDRAAWIGLFARYNMVEDPVGSSPHHSGSYDAKTGKRGLGPLERFFDTFIAPNDIRFHVDRDIICDNHVIRDLTIEIKMSDKVTAHVPMHALYELVEEDGELKIVRLAAYWELWPMVKQILALGLPCAPVLASLGMRMLSIQGIVGTLGFCRGIIGVGEQGKQLVSQFVSAMNQHDSNALQRLFAQQSLGLALPGFADPTGSGQTNKDSGNNNIAVSDFNHYAVSDFNHYAVSDLAKIEGLKLQISKVMSIGPNVSCNIDVNWQDQYYQGVGLFEFNTKEKKIDAVRFYWNHE